MTDMPPTPLFDALVFTPGDVDLSRSPLAGKIGAETYVLGAFNPGTTRLANGNIVIRHLGIPTLTVPMGLMADIGMPIGLTIAGRAYDDVRLLRIAAAMEGEGVTERHAPRRTPPI